ncbi:MAG: DUF952 domain-containing protein [Pseudomonadota bacterium]|nr:DUF952 domain-containing protein [Pseudomonadota bacterium]MEC7558594.1 DUF952 domain-containing protein [Pseudomonadota bacterium]MEC7852494.1 DUF952 domain-containing protein [Pseudomonadota bacterium]MEC8310038.1 DUF952 domain-containing protein [Pseudomonadota bacterium]MEC8539944.1 DUF952 domain-containing protein [Pseudomonadota bacterium]
MTHIYKICPSELWKDAEANGVFKGAAIDLEDGYIHFSTATQAEETARRHFLNQDDLVLVTIDTAQLDITWEPSRGGDLFPHLYADLPTSAAVHVVRLTCDHRGVPKPPEGWGRI